MVIFVGGDMGAKHGIPAKDSGEVLEKASEINYLVFEKRVPCLGLENRRLLNPLSPPMDGSTRKNVGA
jgi:hypothetical protein